MRPWSVGGRHLLRSGEPWFLLGDTAWELLRRLRVDEAEQYLSTRAAQGFNTVLAVALSEFDGLQVPNVEGHVPFHDLDPGRPDEHYWSHVDRIVELANRHRIVVGMLPTWGSNWHDEPAFFTPSRARSYAGWIARRYREHDIIWVLGGDRPMSTSDHQDVIEAFAAGIRDEVEGRHLMTYHPNGHRSSTEFLPDAGWIDFDMVQSGHTGWGTPNYQMIEQDLARRSARPVLDAEPNYESHPVMSADWTSLPGYFFDAADARRAAYHAVFAGACGHVYGCHEIWQMYDPERAPAMNSARRPWREAIHSEGARQMSHLATLMTEVHFRGWEPAQSLIAAGHGILGGHQRAMAHRHRPAALVYATNGRPVHLDLSRWPGRSWRARWWDPVAGAWGSERAESGPVFGHPYPGRDGVLHLRAES